MSAPGAKPPRGPLEQVAAILLPLSGALFPLRLLMGPVRPRYGLADHAAAAAPRRLPASNFNLRTARFAGTAIPGVNCLLHTSHDPPRNHVVAADAEHHPHAPPGPQPLARDVL